MCRIHIVKPGNQTWHQQACGNHYLAHTHTCPRWNSSGRSITLSSLSKMPQQNQAERNDVIQICSLDCMLYILFKWNFENRPSDVLYTQEQNVIFAISWTQASDSSSALKTKRESYFQCFSSMWSISVWKVEVRAFQGESKPSAGKVGREGKQHKTKMSITQQVAHHSFNLHHHVFVTVGSWNHNSKRVGLVTQPYCAITLCNSSLGGKKSAFYPISLTTFARRKGKRKKSYTWDWWSKVEPW